jgi:hypothetical protein
MVQAVRRRLFTAEARVRSQVSHCEICDGQSGTGTGLSPSTSISPVSINPPMLHTHPYLPAPLSRRTSGRSRGSSVTAAQPPRASSIPLLRRTSLSAEADSSPMRSPLTLLASVNLPQALAVKCAYNATNISANRMRSTRVSGTSVALAQCDERVRA